MPYINKIALFLSLTQRVEDQSKKDDLFYPSVLLQ